MEAKLIIFDKDGTLLDFDAFWISLSVKALEVLLEKTGAPATVLDEILTAFGVRDGKTDPNGVLCKGTYAEMGEIAHGLLAARGCSASRKEVSALLEEAYAKNAACGEVKPTCAGLAEALTRLKQSGAHLALVTTDNEPITRLCLQRLGIEELFEAVCTDDGVLPTKPDPYHALALCKQYGISPSSAVMVGDTMTDVRFAKNAGLFAVALAASEQSRALLAPHADAVISEITALLPLLGLPLDA